MDFPTSILLTDPFPTGEVSSQLLLLLEISVLNANSVDPDQPRLIWV